MRCFIFVVAAFFLPAPALAANRPNLVLLLTDDQRWDCLGCAGHPFLKTPNIDRLAAEGVHFRNAFVTTSICCVSRASYFTGRMCRHHGVGDFNTPLPPRVLETSLPAMLKAAGYRTGIVGKWGIGGREPRELFDMWDAWGGQGEYAIRVGDDLIHNSEYLSWRARQFLAGCRRDQPFCLLVLFKAPHDKFLPDPRDSHLFDDLTIVPPKTATQAHFKQMPPFLQRSLGKKRADDDIPTPEKYQQYVKDYLRLIAGVDRAVGQILCDLDRRCYSNDTVVVFGSDNGYFLGERGLVHKWLMYEESIRVPLIVRYPPLPAAMCGQKIDALALNIDLAPTLYDLAGLTPPPQLDGHSLRPLLEGRPVSWRTDFFYEHHFDANGTIPRVEGVRGKRWKYITYPSESKPCEELFDLVSDPHEEHNLAATTAHRLQLEEMRKRYKDYLSNLGPPVLPRARN
jgi:arylsulfatase A-like enzyme